MPLFLDSAVLSEAKQASDLGFVFGATTNPALLVNAGHKDFRQALQELCGLLSGPVFYQLTAHTLEEMRKEYGRFKEVAPNLGIKIPCTLTGLRLCKEISAETVVAITSVFNPSQAYLAAEAGAQYVIPYVNRTDRYTGSGQELVGDLVMVLQGTPCQVLAAGIKTPYEAIKTLLSGAQNISVAWEVIPAMAENLLSQQAIDEFDKKLAEAKG